MRLSTHQVLSHGLFAWLVLLILHGSIEAAVFQGYAQVGSQNFDVTLEIRKNMPGSYWVAAAVSQSGVIISRIGIQIADSGATAQLGDDTWPIRTELARLWLGQLDSKFLDLLDTTGFLIDSTTDSAVTCESRNPIMLTEALAGKVKLIYRDINSRVVIDPTPSGLRGALGRLELTEIHAFSLEEWLNGFGERVILSLRRTVGAEGGVAW